MKVTTRSTLVVGKDRREVTPGTEGDSAKDFGISEDRLPRLLASGLVEEVVAPAPPEKGAAKGGAGE